MGVTMKVSIDLPEDVSAALSGRWDDVPRRSLEAIAVEGYRTGALTETQVRRLLQVETRFQVHALLKEHHVSLRYNRTRSRRRSPRAARGRRSARPMIDVADTGPLHYLIVLDHAELLHRSYGEVVVHRGLPL